MIKLGKQLFFIVKSNETTMRCKMRLQAPCYFFFIIFLNDDLTSSLTETHLEGTFHQGLY